MHLHNRNCSFLSARTILGGLAVAVEINGYFWGQKLRLLSAAIALAAKN